LNRDLQLAPVDTSATLNDRPAAEPAPAPSPTATTPPPATPTRRPSKPTASRPAAPAPKPVAETPAPAAAPSRALAAGTSIEVTTTQEIRSNKNKVGDEVTATVASDVKDAAGRTVIPAGSTVTLAVTAIHEAENKSDKTGTLTLEPRSVTINGVSYPVVASIDRLDTKLEGRGTGAGDIAKVGAGAGIGAVVGRVLGGSTKGAVIGGVLGGAVGAQRAVETKDRDVVVPAGTRVQLTLSDRFVASK
jgi:hypothetical protein